MLSGIGSEGSDDESPVPRPSGGLEGEDDGALSEAAGSDGGEPGGQLQIADEGEAPRGAVGSRVVSKIASGEQTDLAGLKQQIHDDAALLGCWRKAKQLGDKRSRDEVFAALVTNCATYFSYSEELAEYFLQMFSPEQAVKLFEANETHRPLTIRTNSLKARRTTLMQALNARKVRVDVVGDWSKVGLKVFDSAVPVGATPEYLGGQYMIQSASSFIPVMALAPQQDEVILDMAAAPGGKTTYIGQLMRNTGTLFANDLRAERCKALVANVHRMGLTNVIVTNVDGRKLSAMLPKLDRVLLDAPCTGSGIIARDPAVKVKRGKKDFEEHSKVQKELLMCAIDMVDSTSKTGGYIVYSTCSISVEENEAVVDHALRLRNVELVSFTSAVNFGVEGLTKYRERRFSPSMSHCRRYYPHVHNMDGFFVAKLKKTSNAVPERPKLDRSKGSDHLKSWGEEHWTPEMMETVMDFPPPGEKKAAAKADPKKTLNKIERKKLKRAEKLQARAISTASAEGASAGAASSSTSGTPAMAAADSGADERLKEPEEEPKPRKKLLKKKKVSAERVPEASEKPEAKKTTKSKKRKAAGACAGQAGGSCAADSTAAASSTTAAAAAPAPEGAAAAGDSPATAAAASAGGRKPKKRKAA